MHPVLRGASYDFRTKIYLSVIMLGGITLPFTLPKIMLTIIADPKGSSDKLQCKITITLNL